MQAERLVAIIDDSKHAREQAHRMARHCIDSSTEGKYCSHEQCAVSTLADALLHWIDDSAYWPLQERGDEFALSLAQDMIRASLADIDWITIAEYYIERESECES